tara:strand:- start:1142 stop:1369 length:228 start_codon:yes stop_codon:yes gene_type:complete
MDFAALAQAEPLALLDMHEYQFIIFLPITLEGDKRIQFILAFRLFVLTREPMPDSKTVRSFSFKVRHFFPGLMKL